MLGIQTRDLEEGGSHGEGRSSLMDRLKERERSESLGAGVGRESWRLAMLSPSLSPEREHMGAVQHIQPAYRPGYARTSSSPRTSQSMGHCSLSV
jgi:hypothetical protein